MDNEGTATVTIPSPPDPPLMLDLATTGGGFTRAAHLTMGDQQKVTLPDDGGSELLIGTTSDFAGTGIAVDVKPATPP